MKYTQLVNSNKKAEIISDEPPMQSVKITDMLISPRQVTQATIDRLVLNFVCEASQPFSVVEAPPFKTCQATELSVGLLCMYECCVSFPPLGCNREPKMIQDREQFNDVVQLHSRTTFLPSPMAMNFGS
ncbi:hypothetical protein ILYODFUR_021443 [Ilyodon furcidens]|uniref:Uncharacterized protein n=1 Tax=Ilyodon furcidens TaxID=33524 RepID=A0ABV0TP71_9TELE